MHSDPVLIRRGCLHHIDGERLYVSQGPLILHGLYQEPLQVLARLPLDFRANLKSGTRLSGRLLRNHVYHIVTLPGRLVVMGFGRIWCLDRSTGELLGAPVPIVGGRPLVLCVAPEGLYYGEYRNNAERTPIRVMFSADGLHWHAVHSLYDVRHIHGIYYDSYTDALWMTTGDEDKESALWRTFDGFSSVAKVRGGSQQFRAIPLLFTREHIFFGSDTPLEKNYLYRYDRDSGRVDRVMGVEGSVFHASRVNDGLLFATAVEPSAVNTGRDAVLYASKDGNTWRVVARHRKDFWHMTLFQYGQLIMPSGNNQTGKFWYSTFAVKPDYSIYSGQFDAS